MSQATDKVVFASPAWIERARLELESLAAEHGQPGERFSLCEVFTEAPAELAADGTIAWYFYIDGKNVRVGTGEVDDADVKAWVSYAKILPTARLIYTPEYLAERANEPAGSQFDKAEGDFSRTPAYITELHNRLAAVTA